MFKLIGFVIIMIGTTGLGFCMSRDYVGRLEQLGRIKQMMEYLIGQITYEKATLPEAFLQAAKRMEEPYKGFLADMVAETGAEKGESLGRVWNTCAARLAEELLPEDLADFCNVMGQTGFADAAMQIKAFESYIRILEEKMNQMEQERASKCRIYQTLGVMSGFFLIIILW